MTNPHFETGIYDPVQFIKKNSTFILPHIQKIHEMEFSGFARKAFHSNKRPKGVVTINPADNNPKKRLRIFVKQHSNAMNVFKHTRKVYAHFKSIRKNPHIPKPIYCDPAGDVNYMEYIAGTPLNIFLLRELIIGDEKRLKEIFHKIGSWLSDYHYAVKMEYAFLMDGLFDIINFELNQTNLFSSKEKLQLKEYISRMDLNSDFLIMTKTHNDFTLRNIIYTKEHSFYVIDWDAIFNEKFKLKSPIWIDIISFLISFNSYKRFSPLVTNRKIDILNESFLMGYFNEPELDVLIHKINTSLYLFTLGFYLGVIGEKPLPLIYKEKLGFRYMKLLRNNLISGKVI